MELCAHSFVSFTHSVIDQQLHRIVSPLNEHQLVGLSRHGVREGRPESRPDASLHPQTQREGEDLVQQRALHPTVHVVGSHWKADLESFTGFALLSRTCGDDHQRQGSHYAIYHVFYIPAFYLHKHSMLRAS